MYERADFATSAAAIGMGQQVQGQVSDSRHAALVEIGFD